MLVRRRFLLLFLILVTFFLAVVTYFLLRVRRVECSFQDQACPVEISSLFEGLKGQPLFFFNGSQLNDVLANQPAYQVATYSLRLPDTLLIRLAPQNVAYVIKPLSGTEQLAVTNEGIILNESTSQEDFYLIIPDLEWNEITQSKTLSSTRHAQLQAISSEVKNAKLGKSAAYLIDTQTLLVYLPNNPVYLLDPLQLKPSLTRLKLLLTQQATTPLSSEVQEVDVRYKLPVLRTSTSLPRHNVQ